MCWLCIFHTFTRSCQKRRITLVWLQVRKNIVMKKTPMSEFIRGLGSFIGIAGGLLGFVLSLFVAYSIFGISGVVGGLFLLPLVFALLPFYTAFALGSWTLFLLNYGSAVAYWLLHNIANNMEKQAPTSSPASAVTTANPIPAPVAKPVLPLAQKNNSARNALFWIIGIMTFLFLALNSSNTSTVPAPTPIRTRTPIPTRTPNPAVTATPKPISLKACVTNSTIRIRRGPGTDFEAIGGLVSGTCMQILGRNQDSSWVYMLTEDSARGWVAASLLTIDGNVNRAPIKSDSGVAQVLPTAKTQPTITSQPFVFASRIPQPAVIQSVIPCSQSASRSGDLVTCQIEMASCDYRPDVDGSPTFCNDRPYPNHNFTLVVFDENWSDYDGLCIMVTGNVDIFDGHPQIQAFNRSQVSIC
jgi:hypothetical protein